LLHVVRRGVPFPTARGKVRISSRQGSPEPGLTLSRLLQSLCGCSTRYRVRRRPGCGESATAVRACRKGGSGDALYPWAMGVSGGQIGGKPEAIGNSWEPSSKTLTYRHPAEGRKGCSACAARPFGSRTAAASCVVRGTMPRRRTRFTSPKGADLSITSGGNRQAKQVQEEGLSPVLPPGIGSFDTRDHRRRYRTRACHVNLFFPVFPKLSAKTLGGYLPAFAANCYVRRARCRLDQLPETDTLRNDS
jgi:hypothetical protein